MRLHFDGNRYCVPHRFAGRRLTLKADSSSVTIYDRVTEIVSYAPSWRRGQTFGAERFEAGLAEFRPAAQRLLDLSFIANGTNLIFIGNPGVGKTFLSKIVGWRACQSNQRVLFTAAMDMLNHLLASQVDHSLVRK
jgi:DNA replication protein DnaC